MDEGIPGDGVCALFDLPNSNLRLYCIRYGNSIIILGGGGQKPKTISAFQENEKLAKQFEVISSCVVVAMEKDGKIIEYKRLDEVWTLLDKPAEFNAYLSKAIQSFQAKQEGAK